MSIASPINRVSPAVPKDGPSLPETVPPALRFMLEPESIEDGRRFYKDMDALSWTMIPDPASWAEKYVIGGMARRWPAVARADAAVGGLLSEALRVVAAKPRSFPRWWLFFASCLATGHPEKLRQYCRLVLDHAGVTCDPHETFAEEETDRPMRAAQRHWSDRDLAEADESLD